MRELQSAACSSQRLSLGPGQSSPKCHGVLSLVSSTGTCMTTSKSTSKSSGVSGTLATGYPSQPEKAACQPLADGACVASRHTVVVGVLADLEGHSVGIGFDLGYSPVVRWMWIPEGLRGLALRWPSRLNASLVWSSPWWPAVGSAHRTTQCQMTPRPVLALCPQGALSTCGRSGAAVAAGIPRLPLPHDAQLTQDWQAGVGENGQGANSESRALIGFSEEQLDRLSVQVVYR